MLLLLLSVSCVSCQKQNRSGSKLSLLVLFHVHLQAIQMAEQYDRVSLRTVYYRHAKHLESLGDVSGALT